MLSGTGTTVFTGTSIRTRWVRITPDLKGITPNGVDRVPDEGLFPTRPSFWRISTSKKNLNKKQNNKKKNETKQKGSDVT